MGISAVSNTMLYHVVWFLVNGGSIEEQLVVPPDQDITGASAFHAPTCWGLLKCLVHSTSDQVWIWIPQSPSWYISGNVLKWGYQVTMASNTKSWLHTGLSPRKPRSASSGDRGSVLRSQGRLVRPGVRAEEVGAFGGHPQHHHQGGTETARHVGVLLWDDVMWPCGGLDIDKYDVT